MNITLASLLFATTLLAQSDSIRATITGGEGDGKCTLEVEVDGSADVEIRGDRGTIRQLSGQPARWRRLVCNQPLPYNPGNFRFKGVDGRGQQQLVRDPNSSGGVAVIRIQDSKGGSEGYTGDIEWRGGSTNFGDTSIWDTARNPRGNWNNSISSRDAMRICKNQVIDTRNVDGNRVTVRPGQPGNDGDMLVNFSFRNGNGVNKSGTCTVSATGQPVQIQMEGGRNNNRTSWNQALTTCQDEAARRLGINASDIRVQQGLDPGNGNILVNFQAQDRSQRIRSGSCRISPSGDVDGFRTQ